LDMQYSFPTCAKQTTWQLEWVREGRLQVCSAVVPFRHSYKYNHLLLQLAVLYPAL